MNNSEAMEENNPSMHENVPQQKAQDLLDMEESVPKREEPADLLGDVAETSGNQGQRFATTGGDLLSM